MRRGLRQRTTAWLCTPLILGPMAAHGLASGWAYVGPPAISEVHGLSGHIEAGPRGHLYLSYQDKVFARNNTTVRVLASGRWRYAGGRGTGSVGWAWYNPLAFGPRGQLFIAHRDYDASPGSLNCRAFRRETNSWQNVGDLGFDASIDAHYVHLAIDELNRPIVVYQDGSTSPAGMTTVMRHEAGGWAFLGPRGMSNGPAAYQSVAISPVDNRIHVAYRDAQAGGRTSAMVYDEAANSWSYLGPRGFSLDDNASNSSIAIDGNGVPHIAYYIHQTRIVVMRLAGTGWVRIGGDANAAIRPTIATEAHRQQLSIEFDQANRPYVAFQDRDDGRKAVVTRYRSGHWETLGAPGFSPAEADYLTMTIKPNDKVFVAFRNGALGNRISVMGYEP